MTPEPNPADDRRARFYESFAEVWDERMNQDEVDKRLRLVFGRLLREEDVRGKRVLDAGAGTGRFSRALADMGARLVSLDIGEKLLELVRAKCATQTMVGSVLDLPFPDGAFDLVLSTEVIEHTTDPRRAVREFARVLAPGGKLVLTVPNRLWRPAILLANALHLRPYMGYENWAAYRDLRSWAEAAGLAVESQEGFNLLPHTVFCKHAFDFLDRLRPLHPYMINIALVARRAASR